MQYTIHRTIPEYELARWNGDTLINREAACKWGGATAPPEIGTKIRVTMNRLGTGIVRGYFTEGGWLGLPVELLNPPAWWLQQNPGRPHAHVFGPEFKLYAAEPRRRKSPSCAR
jgi:hypothetical protein